MLLLVAGIIGAPTTCVEDGSCPSEVLQPRCRIHTDAAAWSPYAWRKAFAKADASATGARLTEHAYAYCSEGRGPWAFTSNNATMDECAAKCEELGCECFDYFCEYHESADCACPSRPHVTPSPDATTVACVGDSITAGYLSSCSLDYPHQLQALLGPRYAVSNYGVGGTTLLRHADHPYWNTSAFAKAAASRADIVVIMLGTNDAKRQNWKPLAGQYPADYDALIAVFRRLPSRPRILLMTPPPLYRDGRYDMMQTAINTDLPRLVPRVAAANGLAPPIDLFGAFERHCPVAAGTPGHAPNASDVPCDWIGCGGVDACHPDNVGYGVIARAVRDAIVAPPRGDARMPGSAEPLGARGAQLRMLDLLWLV